MAERFPGYSCHKTSFKLLANTCCLTSLVFMLGLRLRAMEQKFGTQYVSIRLKTGLQSVFGPQPDILKNRTALIVSDTDVLKHLLGRDWLSSIHLNLYCSPSMTSVSEEDIANFKSLRRISANCFQDSGESVHKRLTSLSPNAEIMITSIHVDQPGASKHFERDWYRQSAAKRRIRSQPASGKAPYIMKLILPRGHHPHSCCFQNQELYFGTSGHGDIICEEELLWFDNKLWQWWKERNDEEAQLRI
ncbi:hypothetical protein FOXYSP1_19476 [Fusarium oxysporum f. sp. phaseoli]